MTFARCRIGTGLFTAALAAVGALVLAAGRSPGGPHSESEPRPAPEPVQLSPIAEEASMPSPDPAAAALPMRVLVAARRLRPRGWFAEVLSWLGITLAGLAVAALVFVAVAPKIFGIHLVIVEGKSMEPHIHYGALAFMQDTTAQDVKVGDVIEFTAPQSHWVTTHRVVAIAPGRTTFTTKGDANNAVDQAPIPASQIHAKYLFSIPEVGNMVRWLHTRNGYLLVVLIPGLLIIGMELLSIAKELQKHDDDAPADADPSAPLAGSHQ